MSVFGNIMSAIFGSRQAARGDRCAATICDSRVRCRKQISKEEEMGAF